MSKKSDNREGESGKTKLKDEFEPADPIQWRLKPGTGFTREVVLTKVTDQPELKVFKWSGDTISYEKMTGSASHRVAFMNIYVNFSTENGYRFWLAFDYENGPDLVSTYPKWVRRIFFQFRGPGDTPLRKEQRTKIKLKRVPKDTYTSKYRRMNWKNTPIPETVFELTSTVTVRVPRNLAVKVV